MKKIFVLLAIPTYLLLLAGFSCTYGNYGTQKGKAAFWKKTDPAIIHYLYIDNVEKGVLPFLPDSLTTPGSNVAQKQGLSLTLEPGRYNITAKDKAGNTLCTGTLSLKKTSGSQEIKTSWDNGKCSVEVVYD